MMTVRLALRLIVLHVAFAGAALPATTGILVDRDGRAIAGATIRALSFELKGEAVRRVGTAGAEPEPLATATSDARGRFSLAVDAPYFRIAVTAKGFVPLADRAERNEVLGALRLEPAELVTIRIEGDGDAIASALVRTSAQELRTDENGVAVLAFPKRAGGQLRITHPDWAPLTKSFRHLREIPKTITMSRGISVRGSVEMPDGEPVAGATIFVEGIPAATSDEDGTFVAPHAPSDWKDLTAVRGEQIAGATRRSGAAGYRLRLAPGASIGGTVVDAKTQAPIAGVPVSVIEDRIAMWTAGYGFATQPDALSDARGRFRIAPLPSGAHRLFASRIGYELTLVLVELRAGERAERTISGQRLARISGMVVDEERKAIGGAMVGVTEDSRRPMVAAGMPNPVSYRTSIVHPFWSSPEGEWVVREAPVDRETVLEAIRSGLPSGKVDAMKLAPGEKKEKVVIVVPLGITVSGRVQARGDDPVANATVQARRREPGTSGPSIPASFAGDGITTGANGGFSMQLARGTYDIVADADGYATRTIRAVEVQGEVEAMTIELEEGVSVTGRVVRSDGSGVPDVTVSAAGSRGTATGPDGGFTIVDLPSGPIQLSAFKPADYVMEVRTVEAPATNVEIRLPASGTVRGRVLEKGSKRPLTEFRAGPAGERRGTSQRMMLPSILQPFQSEDGSFELPNVPAGPIEIVAESPGFVAAAVPVTVEEGKATDEVTILLEAGTRVVGRVTAPDGAPLARVFVGVAPSETNPLPGMFSRTGSGTTDANGEYVISAVAAGERSFRANHNSYPPLVKEVAVSGREMRLDLQMESGLELSGTVVREGGAAVSGATVTLATPVQGATNRGALTDANGGFRIEGLAPGRYTVTVRSGAMTKTLRDIDVATAGAMRIELSVGGTIAGRVVGLAPSDLATANVTVSSNDGGSLSTPVRTDGMFRLEGAPAGTTRVVAFAGPPTAHRRTPAKVVEVTAGGETFVDLDFSASKRVSGRVLRRGEPVDGALVAFQMGGGALASTGSAQTNTRGEYVVEGLEDGTYSVFVREVRTGASFRTSYTVAGSGTFDIEMPLAAIRGRVIDRETQEGIAGASISLDSDPPPTFRLPSAQTDASGSFRLDGLGPWTYRVLASRSGFAPEVVQVILGKDADEEIEVRLSRVDGVALRLVDGRDGRALRGFVTVADATGTMILEQALGGSDDVLSLRPGTYRAAVTAGGYATRVVDIAAPGGPYTVSLTPGGTLRIESSSRERVRARILDASGQLLVRSRIHPMPEMLIDPTGATISGIQPGSYTLEIFDADGGIASRVPFTITEGATATIRM